MHRAMMMEVSIGKSGFEVLSDIALLPARYASHALSSKDKNKPATVPKKPAAANPKNDASNGTLAITNELRNLMKVRHIRPEVIDWNLIQDYMESGAYSNKGYKLHNNPGNIMWNKYDKYGTKGSYNAINKTYYSHYPTLSHYINKKLEILNQAPGHPINATSGEDFVHRLNMNNYFGANGDEQKYIDAMKGAASRMNIVAMAQNDANTEYKPSPDEIEDSKKSDIAKWWEKRSMLEKGGLIGGAALFTIIIVKS